MSEIQSKKITFDSLPNMVSMLINEVVILSKQVAEIDKKIEPKAPTDYLTRSDVAKMLKCDLSTIHNWTKKGKLKSFSIGNRIYYRRHEVEDSIKEIK